MHYGLLRLYALAQMLKPQTQVTPHLSLISYPYQIWNSLGLTGKQVSMVDETNGLVIPEALERCQIYQWLRSGEFWTKDFVGEILPQIKIEFGPELHHLKTAKADRKGVGSGRNDTFATYLFAGEDGTFVDENGITQDLASTYYEIDRTLTAVRALLWIGNDQLETFNSELAKEEAEAHERGAPIQERPWSWIRQQFLTSEANVFLPEQAHLCYGLITSVIINDVGKDQHILATFKKITGHDLRPANHDAYLRACIDAGMIPSIDRLPAITKKSVMLGIEVAAECNLGQTAQAENLPASLYPLTRFRNDHTAWRLRFMEQILDLAGAKGHINNKAAIVFGPTVALGNRNCHKAAEMVIHGQKPTKAYNWYLQSRYDYLVDKYGYESDLDIGDSSHRALMRLCCLTGCASKALADMLEDVLLRSEYTVRFRRELIDALDEDGIKRPAIQVTYLPALLNGVLASEWDTADDMKRGLANALEFASRCFQTDDSTRKQWRDDGVTVMERDIFEVSQWVRLGSHALEGKQQPLDFVHDPSLLANAALPELVLVNTIEPGFEDDFRV